MVSGYQELEVRDKLEEVLAHEPRRDLVATGQRLDFAVRPPAAFLSFNASYEARTAKACEISRVAFVLRGGESFNWCRSVVVARNTRHCADKGRFAVCTGAIQEKQRVFLCRSG